MKTVDLPIENPCHEDWSAMTGSRSRHCSSCNEQVHDLSARTEREARQLLRANAGKSICVRYTEGDDGRIAFKTPQPPRRWLARTGQTLAIGGSMLAMAACSPGQASGCGAAVSAFEASPSPISETDRPAERTAGMVGSDFRTGPLNKVEPYRGPLPADAAPPVAAECGLTAAAAEDATPTRLGQVIAAPVVDAASEPDTHVERKPIKGRPKFMGKLLY